MLKKLNGLLLLALVACATQKEVKTSQVLIDKPIIQNLDHVTSSMQSLKHSLVRLRIEDAQKQFAFGTGFFYNSPQQILTTLHTFGEDHICIKNKTCKIYIGLVKNANDVEEFVVQAKVLSVDVQRDLLSLQIEKFTSLSLIRPLKKQTAKQNDSLTAIGFYQDESALIFSQGKELQKKSDHTLTSIIVGHGFSGSPVVNKHGELVGVVTSFHPIQKQPIGLARLIDVNEI